MITLTRAEIEGLIDLPTAAKAIEAAYRAASSGDVTLPPVGHIVFSKVDGDCHIKSGHMGNEPTFVIKIATGFPQNAQRGLPTGNGLVLVMSARTGMVEALLYDEMMLTDIRTGLGGAIASRALARRDSRMALVLGTGPQARRQIESHSVLMPQLAYRVWGRDAAKVTALVGDLPPGLDVSVASDLEGAVRQAEIVITATGSTTPLVRADWVSPARISLPLVPMHRASKSWKFPLSRARIDCVLI